MKRNISIIIAIFLLWSNSSAKIAATLKPEKLFPSSDITKGWTVVRQNAFDGDGLYSHIDGGAELFYEFGFVNMQLRIYQSDKNKDDEITVEIYKMTDADAAYGIFLLKYANLNPDSRLPTPNIVNNYQVVFSRGYYYVLLNSSNGTEECKKTMVKFAAEIGKKIEEKKRSDFSLLPGQSRVKGSERILRGPLSLQSIYPLGDDNLLWEGIENKNSLNAYTADYRNKGGNIYNYIACQYPSSEMAAIGFDAIVQEHDSYLETVESKEAKLVLRDWNKQYVIVLLNGNKIEIFTRLKEPALPVKK